MNDKKLNVLKEAIDYVSSGMAALFSLDIENDKELESIVDELGEIFKRLLECEKQLRNS
jgi:hypothetical protein